MYILGPQTPQATIRRSLYYNVLDPWPMKLTQVLVSWATSLCLVYGNPR